MEKSFSDLEIKEYIPNVVKYNQLEDIDVNNLKLPMIILYLTSENHGHWTLLHKVGNTIEFFDSYGIKPDLEFKYINEEMQYPKYLARLLAKISQHQPIHYNQYQFQAKKTGVNTCGRWCIIRNMYSNIDINVFKRAIDMVCRSQKLTPDQLIVNLT